jgi:hypothetical protein
MLGCLFCVSTMQFNFQVSVLRKDVTKFAIEIRNIRTPWDWVHDRNVACFRDERRFSGTQRESETDTLVKTAYFVLNQDGSSVLPPPPQPQRKEEGLGRYATLMKLQLHVGPVTVGKVTTLSCTDHSLVLPTVWVTHHFPAIPKLTLSFHWTFRGAESC